MCADPISIGAGIVGVVKAAGAAVATTEGLAALSLAATGVSVVGQIAAGRGQQRLANAQAAALEGQGRADLITSLREEEGFRRQTEAGQARQRLALLASGVDPGSGSAAEVIAEDARLAELDALMIRYGGKAANTSARSQAMFRRQEGRSAMLGSFMNAGATVLASTPVWGDLLKRRPSSPFASARVFANRSFGP